MLNAASDLKKLAFGEEASSLLKTVPLLFLYYTVLVPLECSSQ